MEKNVKGSDQKAMIIKELIEGIEIVKQLSNQPSRDDQSLNHSLIDKLLSSFDKTISMAKLMGINHDQLPHQQQQKQPFSSYNSFGLSSPRSENSHHPDLRLSKKRKCMPRSTKVIRISPGRSVSGLEGPLDDGFSWRKYGQKDILGSNFPRGYYRCTHKPSQGCAATKYVQRSDEDPSIYQVTYRGEHTCHQGSRLAQAQTRPNPPQMKTEPQGPQLRLPTTPPTPKQQYQTAKSPQAEVYLDFGPNGDLKVETRECEKEAQFFRSFSFTSALLEAGPIDDYILRCSPAFGSPATSESNHFLVSPYRITGTGVGLNVQTSDSDLYEAISGPNSVPNSPTVCDFEFPLDQLPDIDPNFPFEF